MKMLATKDELVELIEQKSGMKLWRVCSIGQGSGIVINHQLFHEFFIYVTHQPEAHVKWLKEITKDIINVKEINYTGPAIAA